MIVVHPGRMSGKPTIGHSRLPASQIADTYWWHGADEVKLQFDYLTDADILVCCWFVANYGTRSQRKRWREWRPVADRLLWSSETLGDCPWPPRRGDA